MAKNKDQAPEPTTDLVEYFFPTEGVTILARNRKEALEKLKVQLSNNS